MRVKRLSNTSERITYSELEMGLSGGDYVAFPKVLISDVINRSALPRLRIADKKLLNASHFDFVVCDSEHVPQFVIEFDGPVHEQFDERKRKDIRKNRICDLAELPLIRITDFELKQHDSNSLLSFMAFRFAKWEGFAKAFKKELDLKARQYEKGEISEIADIDFDIGFQFDLQFPFPPLEALKRKLVEECRITPFFPLKGSKTGLYYIVVMSAEGSGFGTIWCEHKYGIHQSTRDLDILNWQLDPAIPSPNAELLMSDKVRVSMKWPLPIKEDYDYSISPADYFAGNGTMPVSFHAVPGANMHSIAEAFCEYLSYKSLYDWALDNL